MAAVLLGFALVALSGTIMSVASMLRRHDLALPVSDTHAFQAAHGAGLILAALPMAALAARLGPRPCFRTAIAGMVLLVAAAAQPLDLLPWLAVRFLQGAALAAILVSGLSVLRTLLGEARLGLGLGLAAVAAALATILLPMPAGLLLEWFGRPGLVVPLILLAVPACLIGIPNRADADGAPPRFDLAGAVLGTICLALLLASLHVAQSRPLAALLLLNLGLIVLVLWLWQASRRAAPLLPLDLLGRPGLGRLAAAALAGSLALVAADMTFAAHLAGTWQLPPGWVGGLFALASVAAALASLAGGWRAPRGLALAGGVLLAASLAALAGMPPGSPQSVPVMLALAAAMLGCGVGHGLFEVGIALAVLRGVPAGRFAAAAGLLVLARAIGALLAPFYLVLLPHWLSRTVPSVEANALPLWLGLTGAAALLAALLGWPPARGGRDPADVPAGPESVRAPGEAVR